MTGLSGAFRPGLIEASRTKPRSPLFPRCYPGHFAPASLKPELVQAGRYRHVSLSGAFRPGLIEAEFDHPPRLGRRGLSGAFRPGLIEALERLGGGGLDLDALSGAFRPGLIEAWK